MLVVAAGRGTRLGGAIPKQYHNICGQTVLWHTLSHCMQANRVDHLAVVLAPDDDHFQLDSSWPRPLDVYRVGGATRSKSVLAGLHAMHAQYSLSEHDWVMVHDAARCGVLPESIDEMIKTLWDDPVGGLLALPCVDTIKKIEEINGMIRVASTIPREHIWLAQTPQMFRFSVLLHAMDSPYADQCSDESSAVEMLGLKPRLILGESRHFKITLPDDVSRMAAVFEMRQESSTP
jgi:2-C-methyl-D-erythritol 4-phosphate cytidylyltransferase